VVRRNINRRHMTGDHRGGTAGRATLLAKATDQILGTHRSHTCTRLRRGSCRQRKRGHSSVRGVRGRPWVAFCQEVWELYLQHAEFITPWVLKYPEVKPAFLLVIPSNGTELF
jgi:hypothetical protein